MSPARISLLVIICSSNNLIVSVGACDEHDADCGTTTLPSKSTNRSCRWRVPQGQVFRAVAPSLFQTNVGECDDAKIPAPFNRYSYRDEPGHAWHCETCNDRHDPCNNSHSACGDCSCSDPGYNADHQKTMKRLGAEPNNMMTHFNCDYVKQAFKNPNYNVVNCTDDGNVKEGNISAIRDDAPDAFSEEEIASGLIWVGCTVFPHKISCRRVPIIIKFECDDCINKGSPWMMTQCCSKCKQFVDGLESNPLIPSNVLAFGFCSGCDSENITFEESPMPNWDPAAWDDHKRFKAYTEASAMEKYDHYVEENICTHLTPHCHSEEAEYDHNGHLEECHTGSCPADPQHFGRRLVEGNISAIRFDASDAFSEEALASGRIAPLNTKSVEDQLFCPNLGWRRPLSKPKPEVDQQDSEDLEGEPDDEPDDEDPNPVDVIPKAIIKMTMGLPGSQEMYQTEEAKTALKHGCANTLEVPESWISVNLKEADGGRRLSDVPVSVEFTINVPSTSTMATDAITQSVESVNNADLAMNLQESFAKHAPAVDVATVDFTEVTFSNVEVELVNEDPSTDPPSDAHPPSDPPSEGILGMPVTTLAIVGGAVVLGLGLITAAVRRWRKSKHNREEANKPSTIGRSQPKEADQGDAKEAPVVPQVQDVPV